MSESNKIVKRDLKYMNPSSMKMEDVKLTNRMIPTRTAAQDPMLDKMVEQEIVPHAVKREGKTSFVVGMKDPALARENIMASMEDLTTFMSGHGVNIHRDDFDTLDLFAQHIITLLNTDVYTVANLTKHERFILIRYFYRTNPILGRIIDIHTELPLSKLRLQPPQDCPRIVRDYMMNFYNKIFSRLNVMEFFRDFCASYNLYGEAYGLIDDFFKCEGRVLQDIEKLTGKNFSYTDEDEKFIKQVEEKYDVDPAMVKIEDRLKYLDKKFLGFFNKKYNGPSAARALKFYDITEYFSNSEINFEAVRHRISDGVQAVLEDSRKDYESLKELGYSEGYIELLKEYKDQRDLIIDNDTFTGLPYLVVFKRWETTSLVYKVLDACLQWDAAVKAFKVKVKNLGRIGRVVTAPELGDAQLNALIAEVTHMIEDPSYAVVANYEINWQEVNTSFKDELNQLKDAQDNLKGIIALGLGCPDSLLSGESQYTGDNIKVEVLNTQYFAFKIKFQNLLEDCIMKPIALRKGFIGLDDWGNLKLYYPKLTFSLLNLRSQEYFEMLMNLYNKGSLNVDIIYDLLNLDGEGVIHSLKQDLWTLKNDKFNAIIEDILHNIADQMVQDSDVAQRIIDGLGLSYKDSVQKARDAMNAGGGAPGAPGGGGGGGMPPMGGGGMPDLGGPPPGGDEGGAPGGEFPLPEEGGAPGGEEGPSGSPPIPQLPGGNPPNAPTPK